MALKRREMLWQTALSFPRGFLILRNTRSPGLVAGSCLKGSLSIILGLEFYALVYWLSIVEK
jgi:hypothetical protein